MRLIFLGPPGAGKSTQAAILANQWQVAHIATGAILRQAIARQSAIGKAAHAYVEAGELVPDSLMLTIIQERLRQSDAKRGWILDGFPRNLSQATALEQLMKTLKQGCDRVISFYVPDDVLVYRIFQPGQVATNRPLLLKRLDLYNEQTVPLIQYYRQQHQLTVLNGDRPIEGVTQLLHRSLQGCLSA